MPACFFSNDRPIPDPLNSVQVHLFEWSWDDIAKECKLLNMSSIAAATLYPPSLMSSRDAWLCMQSF